MTAEKVKPKISDQVICQVIDPAVPSAETTSSQMDMANHRL